MTMGYLASEITRAACSTFSSGGSGGTAACTLSGAASPASSAATSSGKSMKLTPGFSASATLNAFRTTSGTISGALT
jgi:hypothetical protein